MPLTAPAGVARFQKTPRIRAGKKAAAASAGEAIGTLLEATTPPVAARKQWLADYLKPAGRVTLDAGAVKALAAGGRSLLAIGATAVEGEFGRGDVVSVLAPDRREIARGLVNYASGETARLLGRPSPRSNRSWATSPSPS